MNKKLNKTVGFKATDKEHKDINKFCDYFNKTKKEVFKTGMIAMDTSSDELPYLRVQRIHHKNKAMYHLHKAIHEFNILSNYNKQIHEKDETIKLDQDLIILHDQHGNEIKFKPQYLDMFDL